MQRSFRAAGFLALVVTPLALVTHAIVVSGVPVGLLGLLASAVLVGGVVAMDERGSVFDGPGSDLGRAAIADIVAVLGGAVVTYLASVAVGLGPVVAAALVGVGAAVALPEHDAAVYCGSFVGMVSPAAFESVAVVAVAGVVAGLAFATASGAFDGFGGKLGTLALFGCLVAGLLTGVPAGEGPPPDWSGALLTIPVAAAGAVATVVLRDRMALGAVLGSALVGLVAGLTAPLVWPGSGERVAAVAFCASFVGMSSTDRLGSTTAVGVAGALCGVVFVAVAPALAGFGGTLGTTAFLACVTIAGAGALRERLADRGVPYSP